MELSFAFFADAATVPPDGKLYVLGGGFSTIALAQLPGMASFSVVAGFRFSAADVSHPQTVELRFVDSLTRLVLPPTTMRFEGTSPLAPGGEVSLSTVSLLQPTLAEPGEYHAQFWHEGALLSAVRLHVVEQPRPGPPQRPGPPLA